MINKFLLIVFAVGCGYYSMAQVGVSYQFSELHPNISVSYGAKNQWWGELRLSADVDLSNFSPEALGLYNFIKKESADFYGGVGLKVNLIPGPMAVTGLNIYPFENRQFGFLAELGFMYNTDNDNGILRGLGGFRYIFNKD